MRKMLMEKDILGKVKAYVYVVEFHKRGLPHAHFLLIMERKYKITCPEQYDMIISVELSNKKKYPELYKMGHDRASVVMRETDKADKKGNIDEIKQYRDAQWVTPPEALWRIYGFDLSKNHPPVQQLQLHLPDMHMASEEARGILYRDFPEHFTWQSNGKFWQKRKNSIFQVGRVISAHPAEGERYFLRVLLNNVPGATSYEHLRTVDGVLLPSFHEAAERRGLIEEDNTLDECLTKATLF
ncbi:uncharacterized protein [Miscanthus floridulus]|uniref:uncharacterized protein n=1 Tax=Miscanthus floridulus TaxID=154761 RepID=UPI003458118D